MVRVSLGVGIGLGLSWGAFANDFSVQIINGSDTASTTYPSIASLVYETGSFISVYCGATILDDRHVLTAAHCIYNDTVLTDNTYIAPQLDNKLDLIFGNVNRPQATRIYYPDEYRDSAVLAWPYDIAIIEVESSLGVSSSAYVNLATSSQTSTYNNTSLDHFAVGHGYVDNNQNDVNQLQVTTLNVYSDSDCANAGVPTSNRVCTTGDPGPTFNNSTCNGDSGGPLYWNNNGTQIQIGITSFGPTTCGDTSRSYTSVFTEVAAYQGWIDDVLNGRESPKIVVGESFPYDFGDSSGGSLGVGGLLALCLLVLRRLTSS